jgi:putative tricarboxylic transport membrane protein
MRKKDIISALIWIFLSFLILEEVRYLPIGTISQPGPGFFPLIIGVILEILSLSFLGKCLLGGKGKRNDLKFVSEKNGWQKIILPLGAMLVYYFISELVGFLIAAFFLVSILIILIEPRKWLSSIVIGAFISLCSYILFEVIFRCNLPQGILEGLGF